MLLFLQQGEDSTFPKRQKRTKYTTYTCNKVFGQPTTQLPTSQIDHQSLKLQFPLEILLILGRTIGIIL